MQTLQKMMQGQIVGSEVQRSEEDEKGDSIEEERKSGRIADLKASKNVYELES